MCMCMYWRAQGAEPLIDGEFVLGDHIVNNSGKMAVLDRLLPRLRKDGHKVLVCDMH